MKRNNGNAAGKNWFGVSAFLILFSFISACAGASQPTQPGKVDPTPLPSLASPAVTSTPSPTTALTVTPTPTPVSPSTPTPAATQTPDHFSDVPDGEYILYGTEQSTNIMFSLISIDGKQQKDLFTIEAVGANISEDKKQVILYPQKGPPYLLDLATMKEETLSFSQECVNITLTRDNQYFLGDCPVRSKGIDIFRYPRNGGEVVPITHCSADRAACLYFHLSPDGKWISYTRIGDSIYKSARDGLYFAPAECIQSDEGCDKVSQGPYDLDSSNSWLSDSQHIANLGFDNFIRIYQFENGKVYYLRKLNQEKIEDLTALFWSLDSTRIACEIANDIYILDVESTALTKIKSSDEYLYILAWVKIEGGKITD